MLEEIKEWEEVLREEIFSKYGRGVERVVFGLPNGKKEAFYLKKENDSICTLAITKDNMVVLAKQFRPGPKKILLEMPGGGLEKNEEILQGAERELLEETGYSGKAQFVTECLDCGYSTRKRFCVVVTNCEKVAEQKLDTSEFIQIVLVSLSEFRQLLRSGQMTDVEAGYLGLDFLGLL